MKNPFRINTTLLGALAVVVVSLIAGASAIAALSPDSSDVAATGAPVRLETQPFNALDVEGPLSVIFVQGEFPGYVEITGSDGRQVRAESEREVLTLSLTGHQREGNTKAPVVRVCSPRLSRLTLNGAASLSSERIRGGDMLTINADGASSLNIGEVSGETVRVEARGASTLTVGKTIAPTLTVRASSASTVKLKGIDSDILSANSSSAASLTLAGHCGFSNLSSESAGSLNSHGLVVGNLPSGLRSVRKSEPAPQEP